MFGLRRDDGGEVVSVTVAFCIVTIVGGVSGGRGRWMRMRMSRLSWCGDGETNGGKGTWGVVVVGGHGDGTQTDREEEGDWSLCKYRENAEPNKTYSVSVSGCKSASSSGFL